MSNIHGFLVAAPNSGSGKTTVSLAIMSALARRGFTVAPFKCGPDFIDPGYHRIITGCPSINLDAWMCSEDFVLETFLGNLSQRGGQSVAVIEGAMGLFDGIGSSTMQGSSGQIAAITGVPVVLVVNARGMAASAAALIRGFVEFDSGVSLAGVIFNNVGSPSHGELLRAALQDALPELAVLGCIPRDESLRIPSRHLGLVTAEDNPLSMSFINQLADMAESCLDLDRLSKLSIASAVTAAKASTLSHDRVTAPTVKIAVARDHAFCFMYEDNLRLLREAGAELVFFSPLTDTALPADTHGIYLPGGYPELYARELHENRSMARSIKSAVAADMPVYAECGGFVYLTEGLETTADHPPTDFVGIFPTRCRMLSQRKALGYRQVELIGDSVIGNRGAVARGHEFHYSETAVMPDGIERCYDVTRNGGSLGTEGFLIRNCLASYIHLHFGSNSALAPYFTAACRKFRRRSEEPSCF